MSRVATIDRSVEKAHIWLNELADELGDDDWQAAYRVLRAYLHTLRDRLTVEEAAHLVLKYEVVSVKYEVVSGDLAGEVDWVTSDAQLRGAHIYRVRFNENQEDPRIVEVLEDLTEKERGR
jgi:hypothetical protein